MLIRARCVRLCLAMLWSVSIMAADKGGGEEPKVVSGMSIVGNKEAPKSLVIVPWKSSEIGDETKLASDLLNNDLKPVDKKVFVRELDFYKVSVGK
jgi:hypothetical protein